MSHAIFSRALCYFVVFPFILQSKEYPRNVPGNPTRKCVEKEVCKKKKKRKRKKSQHGTKEELNERERRVMVASFQSCQYHHLSTPNQSANWDEHGTSDSDHP